MLATPVTSSVEHDFASKSEANHDSLRTPLNALIPCHFHGFFVFFLPPAGPMQIGLAGRRAPILGDDGVLKRGLTRPLHNPQQRSADFIDPWPGKKSVGRAKKSVGRAKKSVGWAKVGWPGKEVGWPGKEVGWLGKSRLAG